MNDTFDSKETVKRYLIATVATCFVMLLWSSYDSPLFPLYNSSDSPIFMLTIICGFVLCIIPNGLMPERILRIVS